MTKMESSPEREQISEQNSEGLGDPPLDNRSVDFLRWLYLSGPWALTAQAVQRRREDNRDSHRDQPEQFSSSSRASGRDAVGIRRS
jgi:hypothetical protein